MTTMSSFTTAVVLLSLLFSRLLAVSGERGVPSPVSATSGFDAFILALQWPSTFCATHSKTCCRENGCCPGAKYPPGFTIHGLWPVNKDGTFPSCCNSDNAFDKTEITPLNDALTSYWPALNCKQVSSCNGIKRPFWADQWEKYGTCASSVTGDQYDYFLETINVYLKYNVTYALYEAGYVPSDTIEYTASGIISAIKFAYATPILSCNKGAIQEVRLCLTKDFELQDCFGYTNCPQNVTLPTFKFRDTNKTKASLDAFYNILSS